MAIYFNNLILEPKADGNSLQKRYYKELEEIKKLFAKFRKGENKQATLTFGRKFRKVYNVKKTSYKPAPPVSLPMNANLYDSELGAVEVRYSRRPPLRNGNTVTWPRDQESLVFEMLSVNEQQLDLAWFLLKASDFVEKGIIKLIDKEVEYEGTFEKIKQQMEASAVIFGDGVVLDDLVMIADMLFKGKLTTQGVTKYELATKIWGLVQANENNKKTPGYKALLDASDKISKGMAAGSKQEDIEVELPDGEKVTIALLKCPTNIGQDKLVAKAEALGLPTKNLSRDIIYSLIKSKS